MISTTRAGLRLILGTMVLASLACREREPVPAYNVNLGTGEQPLLPTALTQYDPELGKSNKKVELPERPEPGAAAAATPPAEGEEAAAPPAEDAGTSGVTPTPDATTSGAAASTVGTNAAPDADTSGAEP